MRWSTAGRCSACLCSTGPIVPCNLQLVLSAGVCCIARLNLPESQLDFWPRMHVAVEQELCLTSGWHAGKAGESRTGRAAMGSFHSCKACVMRGSMREFCCNVSTAFVCCV